MVEGGVISKMEYLRAQEELVDLKRSLDSASAKVKEAKAAIASLEQQRQQASAEFERDRMKELTEAESKVKSLTEDLTKADQRQFAAAHPLAGRRRGAAAAGAHHRRHCRSQRSS